MIDVRWHPHDDSTQTHGCAEVLVDGHFEGRLVLYGGAVTVYRWHDVGPNLTLSAMQPAYHVVEEYEREHGLAPRDGESNAFD